MSHGDLSLISRPSVITLAALGHLPHPNSWFPGTFCGWRREMEPRSPLFWGGIPAPVKGRRIRLCRTEGGRAGAPSGWAANSITTCELPECLIHHQVSHQIMLRPSDLSHRKIRAVITPWLIHSLSPRNKWLQRRVSTEDSVMMLVWKKCLSSLR